MRSIRDFPIDGKRVLVRCDFDVPLDENNSIADDFRLQKILPTIKFLLEKNPTLILIGHIGRPEEKEERYSLKVVSKRLGELLGREVKFIEDYNASKKEAGLMLLENLRFYPEEKKNDYYFAKKLASLADVYVNEAFAASHREEASIVRLPKLLPSYAGLNLSKEVEVLSSVFQNPKHPLVSVIGGAKIETKMPVIKNLLKVSDHILIGGKLVAEKVIYDQRILLPEDVVVAKVIGSETVGDPLVERKDLATKLDSFKIFDIGVQAARKYVSLIKEAKMVIWNGPMGIFEDQRFMSGTKAVAEAIAQSSAFSIVGGGETVLALKTFNLLEKIDHVSTGGGAMLEFLSGKKLPGLEALT